MKCDFYSASDMLYLNFEGVGSDGKGIWVWKLKLFIGRHRVLVKFICKIQSGDTLINIKNNALAHFVIMSKNWQWQWPQVTTAFYFVNHQLQCLGSVCALGKVLLGSVLGSSVCGELQEKKNLHQEIQYISGWHSFSVPGLGMAGNLVCR